MLKQGRFRIDCFFLVLGLKCRKNWIW